MRLGCGCTAGVEPGARHLAAHTRTVFAPATPPRRERDDQLDISPRRLCGHVLDRDRIGREQTRGQIGSAAFLLPAGVTCRDWAACPRSGMVQRALSCRGEHRHLGYPHSPHMQQVPAISDHERRTGAGSDAAWALLAEWTESESLRATRWRSRPRCARTPASWARTRPWATWRCSHDFVTSVTPTLDKHPGRRAGAAREGLSRVVHPRIPVARRPPRHRP